MSRRAPGTNSAGSPGSTRSTSRTSSSTRPAYSPTRPSTRTVSPTSKRCSSTGTPSHTRARTRPLLSVSSRSRNGRPSRRVRRSLRDTAKVASTSAPAASSRTSVPPAIAASIEGPAAGRCPGKAPRRRAPRVSGLPSQGVRAGARARGDTAVPRPPLRAPIACDLADVVSPPYDVIDGDLRRRLLDRSPYNVVHLILPEPGEEREAGDTLEAWRREQVVVREPRPCMYWLEQDARGPDGVRRRRAGLIAALRLEPYAPGRVRRHERTMDGAEGRAASRCCAPCAPISRRSSWPTATRRGASARPSRRSSPSAPAALRDDRRGGHRRTASGGSARTSRCASRSTSSAAARSRSSTATTATRRRSPIATSAAPPTAIRTSCAPTTSRPSTSRTATTRGSCSSPRIAS